MNIKEFAKSISGKEYGCPQFTKEEIETAKENGFVIVYGASDDLMEFDGAIQDEGGCFNGGKVYFNRNEVCQDNEEEKNYPNWINAVWDRDEDENGNLITWTYETEIPHKTFMIYEDREPYCRGIVFGINDVKYGGEMLDNPIFWIPVRTIAATKEDQWIQCTKCGNMINEYELECLRFDNKEEYKNAIKEKYRKCEKCGSKMDTALTCALEKRGIAKGDYSKNVLGETIEEIMDSEDYSFYKKYGF